MSQASSLMSQAPPLPKPELLTSWKEIAGFLGKGVRTVQRWEATLGLPVIRPANSRSGIVMARPSDLESWIVRGGQRPRPKPSWQLKDNEVRATFAECMQEFRHCRMEVKALREQVSATHETLRREIERLKVICHEWDLILGQRVSGTNQPTSSKMN